MCSAFGGTSGDEPNVRGGRCRRLVWGGPARTEAGTDRERVLGWAEAGAGTGLALASVGRHHLVAGVCQSERRWRGRAGERSAGDVRVTRASQPGHRPRQGRAERWAFERHGSPRGGSGQGDKDKGSSELPRCEDTPGRGAWASRGEAGRRAGPRDSVSSGRGASTAEPGSGRSLPGRHALRPQAHAAFETIPQVEGRWVSAGRILVTFGMS